MKQLEISSRSGRLALCAAVLLAMSPAYADPASAPAQPQTPMVTTPATPTSPAAQAPANAPAAQTPSTTPATPSTTTPSNNNQVNENSASYVDGYSDGCASANLRYARQAHVKPNRDAKLYDSDANYHEGWDRGYRKCEDRMTPGALPVMGNSIIM